MGQLEKRGRKRKRKRDLRRGILTAVSVAGLLALAAVPSNLPAALKRLGMVPTGPRDVGSINRARTALLRKGLIVRNGGFLRLSPKGSAFLQVKEAGGEARTKKQRWDGRWRIVMFDIPGHRRSTRDGIRRTLTALGFMRLQYSVWAYPYDCEELIVLLKADLKVGKDLLYLIVDELEGDDMLRRQFHLS